MGGFTSQDDFDLTFFFFTFLLWALGIPHSLGSEHLEIFARYKIDMNPGSQRPGESFASAFCPVLENMDWP